MNIWGWLNLRGGADLRGGSIRRWKCGADL